MHYTINIGFPEFFWGGLWAGSGDRVDVWMYIPNSSPSPHDPRTKLLWERYNTHIQVLTKFCDDPWAGRQVTAWEARGSRQFKLSSVSADSARPQLDTNPDSINLHLNNFKHICELSKDASRW